MKALSLIKTITFSTLLALATYNVSFTPAFAESSNTPAISLDNVSGTWIDPTSNGSSVTNISGIGSKQISWGSGVAPTYQKSSYAFKGNSGGVSGVTLNTPFALGTFTHNNFAIQANNPLTNVSLKVSTTISIDGKQTEMTNMFGFSHNETPNVGGGNCCNDSVSFRNMAGGSSFIVIDGVKYTISLVGFSTDGGATLADQFSTVEGQSNVATLYAMISRSDIAVPEPSTYLMMGSMLALGVYATRRKNKEKIDIRS